MIAAKKRTMPAVIYPAIDYLRVIVSLTKGRMDTVCVQKIFEFCPAVTESRRVLSPNIGRFFRILFGLKMFGGRDGKWRNIDNLDDKQLYLYNRNIPYKSIII